MIFAVRKQSMQQYKTMNMMMQKNTDAIKFVMLWKDSLYGSKMDLED